MTTSTATHLDDEIARVKKANAERLAKLRRKHAAAVKRCDERVVALLKSRHADRYAALVSEANGALVVAPLMSGAGSNATASAGVLFNAVEARDSHDDD